jgi:hypothetical protein
MKSIVTLLVIVLGGCATAPKSALTFDQVTIREPEEGKGILIFYRVVSPPAAYDMHVIMNNREIVSLPNEAFSWVELEAGKHKLEIDWSNWSGMPGKSVDVEIVAGARNYLELTSSVGEGPAVDLLVDSIYGIEDKENERGVERHERQLLKCCRYVPSTNLGPAQK